MGFFLCALVQARRSWSLIALISGEGAPTVSIVKGIPDERTLLTSFPWETL